MPSFLDAFKKHANKDTHAIVHEGKTLSYAKVDALSDQYARHLLTLQRTANNTEQARIMIYMPRSPKVLIARLAVMKAGMVSVVLEPEHEQKKPKSLQEKFTELSISQVLTQTSCLQAFEFLADPDKNKLINIDELTQTNNSNDVAMLPDLNKDQDAYIVYTSGSSGEKPKPIMGSHEQLYHNLDALNECLKKRGLNDLCVKEDSRVALFVFVDFDACEYDITMTWGAGACLYLVPTATRCDPVKLGAFYRAHQITHAVLLPSVLATIKDPEDLKSVKVLCIMGESLPQAEFQRWANVVDTIVTGYGPSETGISATHAVIASKTGNIPAANPIPIGQAREGLTCFIVPEAELPEKISDFQYWLDTPPKALSTLTVGQEGELLIAGKNLGHYVGDSQRIKALNKKVYAKYSYGQIYRTLDVCQYRDDQLYFCHNAGDVLKINGKKVSLPAINTIFEEHPKPEGIKQVVAIKGEFKGKARVVLVLIIDEACDCGKLAFRSQLRALFEKAFAKFDKTVAMPVQINTSKTIAFNNRGKFDDKKLLAESVSGHYADLHPCPTQPRNDFEKNAQKVWAELLDISNKNKISVFDDFFYLGGESLSAGEMLSKIKSDMSLDEFYDDPTIAALARHVERHHKPDISQLIREARIVGSSTRAKETVVIVLCPTLFGDAEMDYPPAFINMLKEAHKDTQIYLKIWTLKSPGLFSNIAMAANIETMAQSLAETVATKLAECDGKIRVACVGWSSGGLLAWQMAHSLLNDHLEWSISVMMLDTLYPTVNLALSDADYFEKKLQHLFALEIFKNKSKVDDTSNFIKSLPDWLKHLPKALQADALINWFLCEYKIATNAGDERHKFLNQLRAYLTALASYQPQLTEDGPKPDVYLFTAENSSEQAGIPPSKTQQRQRLAWPETLIKQVISCAGGHRFIVAGGQETKELCRKLIKTIMNNGKTRVDQLMELIKEKGLMRYFSSFKLFNEPKDCSKQEFSKCLLEKNEDGHSILWVIVQLRCPELLSLFLQYLTKYLARTEELAKSEIKRVVNELQTKPNVPLLFVALESHLPIKGIKKLIEAGAELNLPMGDNQQTALHLAARHCNFYGIEIFELFSEHRADFSALDPITGRPISQALLTYASENIINYVAAKEKDAGIDSKTAQITSSAFNNIRSDIYMGYIDTAKLGVASCDKGVVDQVDGSGFSLYHYAVELGNSKGSELIEMLANKSTKMLQCQSHANGHTALHIAVLRKDRACAEALCKLEDKLSLMLDKLGRTPTDLAIDDDCKNMLIHYEKQARGDSASFSPPLDAFSPLSNPQSQPQSQSDLTRLIMPASTNSPIAVSGSLVHPHDEKEDDSTDSDNDDSDACTSPTAKRRRIGAAARVGS